MQTAIKTLILCTFVLFAGAAFGLGTPDGYPPSVEEVCSSKHGAAFGLCNAYCEAMDCELANDGDPNTEPHASASACSKVESKYTRITGEEGLPCENIEDEDDVVVCPCSGMADFDRFAGTTPSTNILVCALSPVTLVSDGANPYASDFAAAGENYNAPGTYFCGTQDVAVDGSATQSLLDISPEQATACADLLTAGAAALSVSCQ